MTGDAKSKSYGMKKKGEERKRRKWKDSKKRKGKRESGNNYRSNTIDIPVKRKKGK